MEKYKEKLLALDSKTVYIDDLKTGEKIYKYNDVLYKNNVSVLQGLYRFILGESKETAKEYLIEIVNELIDLEKDFNNNGFQKTTYINDDDVLNNEYKYVTTLFNTLKERFLLLLNNYEHTYSEDIGDIKSKLINVFSRV